MTIWGDSENRRGCNTVELSRSSELLGPIKAPPIMA
jgi:hypothetical protein